MKNLIIKFTMKTIKFKGKNTIFLNGMEYKGYNVGDLPPSLDSSKNIMVLMKMVTSNTNMVNQTGLTTKV